MVAVMGMALVCPLLSGCSQASSLSDPPVVTRAASVFRSTHEAGVAAQAVYVRYATESDAVGEAGGVGVERLKPLVTAAALRDEQAGADYLQEKRLRVIGESTLVKFQVHSANLTIGNVTAYACLDLTKSRVVNAASRDVTPANRKNRQTSIVEFVWRDNRLLLNKTSAWSGNSIC
jgi:hypothetical protein